MNRKPLDPRLLLKFRGLVARNVVGPLLDQWAQRRIEEDQARRQFIAGSAPPQPEKP